MDVKRYRFLEVLKEIENTKKRIRIFPEKWSRLGGEYLSVLEYESGVKWWPSIETQQAKIWEIEPEDIYVWCRCLKGNDSVLSTQSQKNDHTPYPDDDEMALFEKKGLFPKDKYQKFKLVPVED